MVADLKDLTADRDHCLFNVNYFGRSATIILAAYHQGDFSLTASFY